MRDKQLENRIVAYVRKCEDGISTTRLNGVFSEFVRYRAALSEMVFQNRLQVTAEGVVHAVRKPLKWALTDAAVEDYCDFSRLDAEDVVAFRTAKSALTRRLETEELASKSVLESGCELYRFKSKPRIYIVVDPKTQKIVAVRPEHEQLRRYLEKSK